MKVTALEGNTGKAIHLCSDLRKNWCDAVVVGSRGCRELRKQGLVKHGKRSVGWRPLRCPTSLRTGLGQESLLLQENELPTEPV